MSSPLLAADFRIGAPGASYDIIRVTTDPRVAPGLTADLGTMVEYIGSQGGVYLMKYTGWDTAWRVPGEGPLYPRSAADFAAATKITPSALYLMEQMTGDAYDSSGNANTLTATLAPTPQRTLEGKNGAWMAAAGSAYDAAVNDPAANSFLWGGEAAVVSNGAAQVGMAGRIEAAAFGFVFYVQNGTINYLLKDAAGNTVTGTVATVNMITNPVVPYLVVGQVDKAAARFRARVSRAGASIATVDVSIAALGTFTKAAQRYGVGAIPTTGAVFERGIWVPYNFYATGAQCEGSNVLRDLAVGLGWEY